MSSEKDNETFGQKVTLMILCAVLSLWVMTYTFNLFKPYLVVACVVDPAPVDPAES